MDFTQLGIWIQNNTWLVVLAMSLLAAVILVFMVFRHKENRNRYRLAQEYLMAGKEIPANLLKENSLYARAVKNLFLGIGLVFFLGFLTETWVWASLGLLLIALGVGQMIVFKKSSKDFTKDDFEH